MSIRCPHCGHEMSIKGAKPGHFTPKCEKCHKRFVLIMPREEGKPPVVMTVEEEVRRAMQAEQADSAPEDRPEVAVSVRATAHETAGPATAAHHDQVIAPPPPTPASELTAAERELSGRLGGYEVKRRIGRGGMGSVYLARQVSLDRDVAVKVMNHTWSKDPEFIARFTREAYAAAQLVHHNVVQIHDIGAHDGTHFFSMEYVDGLTLAELKKREGKLDPEAAAGYVLQAARALKFAHEQGMIHRDIKPENLLLSRHGVVKVADLGLVKTPDVDVDAVKARGRGVPYRGNPLDLRGGQEHETLAKVAMGTPAYMAPEQAADAASVDARADIYSLGCTLYALVTGKPPFEGKTADEVMTKHQTEPIKPPELVVSRVPAVLSRIVQKMTAKRPEERYRDMGEVIHALEGFLGVDSTGPFSPREEHAKALEDAVSQFNASPRAKQRRMAIRGFTAACVLGVAGCAATGHPIWAGAFLGLLVLTALWYIAITGVTQRTTLFRKLRQFAFSSGWADWVMVGVGVAAALVLLYVFNLLWVWVGVCVLALFVAAGSHAVLDTIVWRERREAVARVEEMLKSMRLRGLEENALRMFVCKYAGRRWEEFYEALFGYDAKMEAREKWGRPRNGDRGSMRKKHGAWRDPIIVWLDHRTNARKEARERALLQALEERELRHRGVEAEEAKARAARDAERLVEKGAAIRDNVVRMRAAETLAPGSVRAKSEGESEAAKLSKRDRQRVAAARRDPTGVLAWLIGARTRFILGAILLVACLIWLKQNDLLKTEHARTWLRLAIYDPADAPPTRPLNLLVVPERVTRMLFNTIAPGLAGLVLLASSLWRSWLMGALVILAAAVIFAGAALGMPDLEPLGSHRASLAIGGLLAVLALTVARK